MTKIKVIKRYSDVVLKRIVEKDEELTVSEARAAHLVKEGMAEIVDEGKQAKTKGKEA